MLRRVLLCLLLCTAAGLAHARAKVLIVSSDNSQAYVQAVQTLTSELISKGLSGSDVEQVNLSEWGANKEPHSQPAIYVALGTAAAQALASSSLSAPVLVALIPRASFERVLRSSGRKASRDFTAIYLDQPLQRQLAMVRLAMPSAKRLGVLWGPDSRLTAPALHAQAAAKGFSVQDAVLSADSEAFTALQQVIGDSDVFLAVADTQVFNSHTILNILLTTFRAQVPVVAFSPAYVRAGALFALFATPEQVARQSAVLVLAALRGKPLPSSPVESDDFEVSVNANVARALNLSLDANAIRSALRQQEKLP